MTWTRHRKLYSSRRLRDGVWYSVLVASVVTVVLTFTNGYASFSNDLSSRAEQTKEGLTQDYTVEHIEEAAIEEEAVAEVSFLKRARALQSNKESDSMDEPLLPIIDAEALRRRRRQREQQRRSGQNVFSELHVLQAPSPSRGQPWPAPQVMTPNGTSHLLVDVGHLSVSASKKSCDIITDAIGRFKLSLGLMYGDVVSVGVNSSETFIRNVEVDIENVCSGYPSLNSDESYEIFVVGSTVKVKAKEVWGAMYALETLLQLLHKDSVGQVIMKNLYIKDFPRFKHRGILLDTARHYLNTSVIMSNLDAMAMNKMNVFHWHLVDDQSFPFESQVFPSLSRRGAFSNTSVYTRRDIAEITEYARRRGIRLIPEIDTPGHVSSWRGLSDLLTPCGDHFGPIDPTRDVTYQKLVKLFREILEIFPDKSIHFGGDECSYFCWSENQQIKQFMYNHSMSDNYKALFNYYFTRLQKELADTNNSPSNSIYWQEVFDEGVELHSDAIVHVWKEGGHGFKLAQTTKAGYRSLLSSCWYLNYISYGKDWPKYYTCDPTDFMGTTEQKQLVLGGEACIWGEYIDNHNLLSTLWPRAIAVAERLWSSEDVSNPISAEPRFEEQRCRMIRRGIPAYPANGPGQNCES